MWTPTLCGHHQTDYAAKALIADLGFTEISVRINTNKFCRSIKRSINEGNLNSGILSKNNTVGSL